MMYCALLRYHHKYTGRPAEIRYGYFSRRIDTAPL